MPQVVEDIVELISIPQECISECDVGEQVVDFPVPQMLEEGVEVVRFMPHERIHTPTLNFFSVVVVVVPSLTQLTHCAHVSTMIRSRIESSQHVLSCPT